MRVGYPGGRLSRRVGYPGGKVRILLECFLVYSFFFKLQKKSNNRTFGCMSDSVSLSLSGWLEKERMGISPPAPIGISPPNMAASCASFKSKPEVCLCEQNKYTRTGSLSL